MIVNEHLCSSRRFACGLLEHAKLIRVHRSVFVHSSLDVPPREVTAIGPRKRSRAESSDRGALPVTVIDVGFVFADAGTRKGLAEGPSPGRFRNFVAGA